MEVLVALAAEVMEAMLILLELMVQQIGEAEAVEQVLTLVEQMVMAALV
jgi:hypothetical protein